MIKLRGVCAVAWLLAANTVCAENAVITLAFGGDPGSPLAHAYTYGLPESGEPTYTLRIAVIDKSIKTVFHDTVLTISNPEKLVQSITANRAYSTLNSCNKALDVINEKLSEGLPREYDGGPGLWQRQSADGRVGARAACASERHYPMPVLQLEIALLP